MVGPEPEHKDVTTSMHRLGSGHTSRWKWLVVGTGFMTCWLFDGINYSFGVFLDTLTKDLSSSVAAVSWAGSITRGMIQIVGIIVGPLTRYLDCSTVAVLGCFFGSIAFLVSSFAFNVVYLYLSLGIFGGFCFSMALLSSVISATLIFKKHRGLAVGIITAGGGMGIFFISPSSTWMKEEWGWRWVFRFYALVVMCFIPAAAIMQPQSPVTSIVEYCEVCQWLYKACTCECCKNRCLHAKVRYDDTASQVSSISRLERIPMASLTTHPAATHGSADTISKKPGTRFNEVFRRPRLYFICLAGFLVSLGIFTPPLYIYSYAITRGISEEHATWLLSFLGINNTVSRILIGWFIDLKLLNFLIIYIAGTILGGLLTFAVWNFNSFPLLLLYTGFYGVSMGCNLSMRSVVLVELMGTDVFHESFGIYLVSTGVAALIGPPIAGYVYQATDNYNVVFFISGALMTSGSVVWAVTPWIK